MLYLLPIYLFARLVNLDGVGLLVFLNKCICLFVGYLLPVLHEVRYWIVVNMITKTLLKLNTVAIGNGYIVHVHTEHQTAYIVGIGYSCCNARPNGDALLSLGALPMTNNNLAGNTHAAADMTELDVAMSRLVEVHEVHVDGVPWQLCVILGVEVEKRLLECLQTLDPHLGGREGVHPCDDTNTLLVVVGSLHNGFYLCR